MGAFHLHTLQVKSGRLNVSITCGGPAVENPEEPNDRVMRGIVFKAWRGIEATLRGFGDGIRIIRSCVIIP
jgi:hypothetical protein